MADSPETEGYETLDLSKLTSRDEKKLLTKVKKWQETCRSSRLQFERQWYMNMAFYFGKQWAQWTPSVQGFTTLKTPPAPPWRVRLISNKIRPIIRAELSKLTKERPQAFVVPASSDDEDLMAARAGEQVFEYHWRELSLDRRKRQALFWLCMTGNGFMKDWFDPTAPVGIDSEGQMIKGQIKVEPVSPFHIFVPDIQDEELENQPYFIHSVAKDPEWIKERYGKEKGAEIKANAASGPDVLEQKFFSSLGIDTQPKRYASIQEAWIKPCKDHPDGAVVTWSGESILEVNEGWPYSHHEYPLTKFDHIPTGRFYSESVIQDLIPLQKEYNRTRSQIIEAKNRMSKPQLMAAKGSVNPKMITSEPGLVIQYTPGFNPPTPLPLQNLPQYVIEEQDRIQRDMDDVSSQHEVTKGRTPPGVTAATAISYLQEEDDSRLAPTISSIEEGVEKIGRHILTHVQQFWGDERTIKLLGDDGVYESYAFSGVDLKDNTDLRVETGSATPRSRAAKQAFITELGQMGWIPPDRALRYLDMAETGKLYEEMQVDSRQAQRENLRLAEGTPVPVNDWDNHEVHILEHNNFRKTQKFETLPEEAQIIFQKHVELHEQVLMQKAAEAAPPGGPGGPMGGPGMDGPGGPGGPPGGEMGPPEGMPGGQGGADVPMM
jgi:hypothetical protein